MLKTIKNSTASKTAGLAVTYRAGNGEKFGTCPADCKLNDSGRGCGASQIDFEYLDAVLNAKPRRGESFTYSHFHPLYWAQKLAPNKTTINYSADNLAEAVQIVKNKIAPVVTVVKKSFWTGAPKYEYDLGTAGLNKYRHVDGVRVIRCPAEYLENLGCVNCGGKDGPLCARLNRDYIVGFTGHGVKKKKIENNERGGCYASGGNVAFHWRATAGQEQEQTDGDRLRAFVKTLSPRAIIRHHVAGDIGAE
tara:strand:- start:100 stop:849 length:750 start_codon:yes stop_codon:yes gene_type:complete